MSDSNELTIQVSHPLAELGIDLEQYFGLWSIYQPHFENYVRVVSNTDLVAHVRQNRDMKSETEFDIVRGDIAVVSISGAMTKRGSSMARGGSTIRARRAIRQAVNNDDVSSILLQIESPGGATAGTKELADDIHAANDRKPVVAFIEDIGASAAYWVASQASEVYANGPALVGSIGTYMVINDFSAAAEEQGIKVHVIRAGEFKGAGVPGTEVTEEHLEQFQSIVNETNAFFLDGVAAGRKMARRRRAPGAVLFMTSGYTRSPSRSPSQRRMLP